MGSRYYTRPASPSGGRRFAFPERSSTGNFSPPYDSVGHRSHRNDSISGSSGERIVPINSGYAAPAVSKRHPVYDGYSGRQRRSTLDSEARRPSNLLPASSRNRPVIHGSSHRPASPLAPSYEDRNSHVSTPAVNPKREHKRIYSVDDGQTKLVDEFSKDSRRHDRQDRSYRDSGYAEGRSAYYTPAPNPQRTEDYYSYTDPAGMYRDTEPRWRSRRDSDGRRERPSSLLLESSGPTRSREIGPPPSTRGFDRVNNGISRSGTLPVQPRDAAYGGYGSGEENYGPPARASTTRLPNSQYHDREERYAGYRENTYDERRDGRHRDSRVEDPDVAARGFGIRRSSSTERRHSRTESLDRAPSYPNKAPPRDFLPYEDTRRNPERREIENSREIDHKREYDRVRDVEDSERRYDRERDYNQTRTRDRDGEPERDRRTDSSVSGAVPLAAGAGAVGAASAASSTRDRRYDSDDEQYRRHQKLSEEDIKARARHYVSRDDEARERDERQRDKSSRHGSTTQDVDEEYRRRMQQELERSGKSRKDSRRDRDSSDSDHASERGHSSRRDRNEREDRHNSSQESLEKQRRIEAPRSSRELDRPVMDGPVYGEPGDLRALQAEELERESKVRIVSPPKEAPAPPRGILRKPTEKFPEDPNPIREGVAPLKDAKKGKDIPPGARWTKIDRRLVNPQALEEANERFEERMDCVIVLRVLTKDEIQKLADRTKDIREDRGNNPSNPSSNQISGGSVVNHDNNGAIVPYNRGPPEEPPPLRRQRSSSVPPEDGKPYEERSRRRRRSSKPEAPDKNLLASLASNVITSLLTGSRNKEDGRYDRSDRDRDRDREKDRDRVGDRDRERDRERDRDRDRDRDRERDRDRDRDRDDRDSEYRRRRRHRSRKDRDDEDNNSGSDFDDDYDDDRRDRLRIEAPPPAPSSAPLPQQAFPPPPPGPPPQRRDDRYR